MATQRSMGDIRHFIWDFDGTLLDTYPVIIQNLREALGQYGHDCDPVEAMKLMLTNLPTARNHYADRFGIDREELFSTYLSYNEKAAKELQAEPMAGIREVLERICETGRYNYIFTNRKASETILYLEKYGLTKYFREVVGAEAPCFAYKPAPDALLYLMDKYGMNPQDAVMVGDRDCDLGSARNANMGKVHYVCAVAPETLACDWRVESYEEMLALL